MRVPVGFAASEGGDGVAYAQLPSRGKEAGRGVPVRVSFACRPLPAFRGRDIGYAALTAVAAALRERGFDAVEFVVDDPVLERDIAERRALPTPLVMPYVALRCELNRFREARVAVADDAAVRDLEARARAEATLHVAA